MKGGTCGDGRRTPNVFGRLPRAYLPHHGDLEDGDEGVGPARINTATSFSEIYIYIRIHMHGSFAFDRSRGLLHAFHAMEAEREPDEEITPCCADASNGDGASDTLPIVSVSAVNLPASFEGVPLVSAKTIGPPRWRSEETARLCKLRAEGYTWETLSSVLGTGRSARAVEKYYYKLPAEQRRQERGGCIDAEGGLPRPRRCGPRCCRCDPEIVTCSAWPPPAANGFVQSELVTETSGVDTLVPVQATAADVDGGDVVLSEEVPSKSDTPRGEAPPVAKRHRPPGCGKRWTADEEDRLFVAYAELFSGSGGTHLQKWTAIAKRVGGGRTWDGTHQHWLVLKKKVPLVRPTPGAAATEAGATGGTTSTEAAGEVGELDSLPAG